MAVDDTKHLNARIPAELAGSRLDQVLPVLFPDFSRSRLQQWLKDGCITVDRQRWRQRDKVRGDELVELNARFEADASWLAQDIPLNLVYEDEQLLVVDKPAGMVVHPAAGNPDATLLNALLHHLPELATLPRAGIVHRIDKDTTGLLVVAKTPATHKALVNALKDKTVSREYQAVVTA